MSHLPTGQRLRILQLLVEHGKLSGGQMLELDPSLPRGTIYVTLQRLQEVKLVTSRKEHECKEPGSARRIYEISALGKRATHLAELGQVLMSGGTVRI